VGYIEPNEPINIDSEAESEALTREFNHLGTTEDNQSHSEPRQDNSLDLRRDNSISLGISIPTAFFIAYPEGFYIEI
jgi:hypothetical protein